MATTNTTGLVQAIDGFTTMLDGTEVTVKEDYVLHADHPIAKKHPHLFIAAGKSTEEIHQAKLAWRTKVLQKAGAA